MSMVLVVIEPTWLSIPMNLHLILDYKNWKIGHVSCGWYFVFC